MTILQIVNRFAHNVKQFLLCCCSLDFRHHLLLYLIPVKFLPTYHLTIAIIVSEETGAISVARNGKFKLGLTAQQLESILVQ